MSEWQPIETAPKDGTAVLVYLENKHNTIGCDIYVCSFANGLWFEAGGEGYARGNPILWMPLPPPPKTTESTIDDGAGETC